MEIITKIRVVLWNLGAIIFFVWLFYKSLGLVLELSGIEPLQICNNTEVAEFLSPNGKKLAKLGHADCGATTNFSTGIRIIDLESGRVYRGIFGIEGLPENLTVEWRSNTHLVISNFHVDRLEFFNQKYLSGVKVVLEGYH